MWNASGNIAAHCVKTDEPVNGTSVHDFLATLGGMACYGQGCQSITLLL